MTRTIYSFKNKKNPDYHIITYFFSLPVSKQQYFFRFFELLLVINDKDIIDITNRIEPLEAKDDLNNFFEFLYDFLLTYFPKNSFKQGHYFLLSICKSVKNRNLSPSKLQSLKEIFLNIYRFKNENEVNRKIIEFFWTLPNDKQKDFFEYFKIIFISYGSEAAYNQYSLLWYTNNLIKKVQSSFPNFDFLMKTYQLLCLVNDEKNDKIIQNFEDLSKTENDTKYFFEFFEEFFKQMRLKIRSLNKHYFLLPKICSFVENNKDTLHFSDIQFFKNIFLNIYFCKSENDPSDQIFDYIKSLYKKNNSKFFELFELFFKDQSLSGDFKQGYQVLFNIGNLLKDKGEDKAVSDEPLLIKIFLQIHSCKNAKNPNKLIIKYFNEFFGSVSVDRRKLFFESFKPIFTASQSDSSHKGKILLEIYTKLNESTLPLPKFNFLIRAYLKIYSFKEVNLNKKIFQYFKSLPESDQQVFFQYFESFFYNVSLFDKSSPETPLLLKIYNKILELKQRLLTNGLSDESKKILDKKILHLKNIYIDLIITFSKGPTSDELKHLFSRLEKSLENIKNFQNDDSVKTFFYTKNFFSASASRKSGTLELLDDIEKFIENFWYGKIKYYIFKNKDINDSEVKKNDINASKDIKDSKVNKKFINKNKQIKDSTDKNDKPFPIELMNLSNQIENLKIRMNNFHSEAALKVLKQKQHYLQTTFRLLFNYHMNKSSENLERLAMYLESLHGNKIIKSYSYGCFVSSYAFFKPKKTNTEILLDSINAFVKKADNIQRLGLIN